MQHNNTVFVSPLSLKDLYYIGAKRFGRDAMRMAIQSIVTICTVTDCSSIDCINAADSNEPDFEDDLIRATAERLNVDIIITRDETAFSHSLVRSMNAERYLELFT
ncbi:PIN domain-containing protein [Bifidobacterium gallicum]|uniref:Toxin-antitoxin system, toxin component, PIN family n=1 Tax=Bifidobacterium gallicum DSM 20093 = LMG 11596 TaxID=561180 RepID=A0A087AFW2_9BIFI|nr:PIN domain-containing protein [Bifidobacterium gallicum]KFI57662.1 toxin-antitoxin system, toxin component, PIN family [Bifidobacterium gallicum DSM 20093 = LMG 11596]